MTALNVPDPEHEGRTGLLRSLYAKRYDLARAMLAKGADVLAKDAEGQSIVVEYVKGELRLHNNTKVGVMTNDPTWDWHLQNLINYGTYMVHADGWTDNIQTALRWGPRDS